MENATKALIIAGSILIVIVLIALGISILSSTSDVTDQVDSVSDSMAQSVFNSQFNSYFGNSISGTQTKALVQKVISNNTTSSHKVWLYCTNYTNTSHLTDASTLSGFSSWISSTDKFTINVNSGCGTYANGYNNGYIACIVLTKH